MSAFPPTLPKNLPRVSPANKLAEYAYPAPRFCGALFFAENKKKKVDGKGTPLYKNTSLDVVVFTAQAVDFPARGLKGGLSPSCCSFSLRTEA
jgi:hypothetical protein